DGHFDFVVDAIDTIQPKVALLATCLKERVRVVSSMGAGAKTDISSIQFSDIWQTYHCGLSKSVRSGLTKAGLKGRKLPVVFSAQQADRNALLAVEGERNKKTTAGTISYMPATFGCYLAQYVLERL
ncbi:MAG: tRNA threonylcarbamoyladenosine dehydratase, partial [Bacteroidaceae bacterium]|nr:tRNA threonylcarbamoyladenosine dehydratase [Bacteroidaceae bacterium]